MELPTDYINSSIKEQIIWKNEVKKGFLHNTETQTISNLRVGQNDRLFFLHILDDIIVMNRHSVSQSQYQGQRYSFRGTGVSYGYGSGRSSSIIVGDVAFIYQGKPV